ncbi:hypothetical protein D3C71_1782100 [compost metagenome]
MRQRQRTGPVAILGEREAIALGQGQVILCLLAEQRCQFPMAGLVLWRVHRQREGNAHPAVTHAVAAPGDFFASLEHGLETDVAPNGRLARPVQVSMRPWSPRRPDRDHRAGTDFGDRPGVALRVDRVVDAHDRIASTQ